MPRRIIPREEKKSYKGWAKGVREEQVLEPMWLQYCDAAQRGIAQRRRVVELICERFHFQIPPDTPVKAEIYGPVPPWTPETIYDPFEGLTSEEDKQERHVKMEEINRRIEKYYAYRYSRISHAPALATDAASNPYNIFLNQLCGITRPSRGRSAAQHYQSLCASQLAPIYQRQWTDNILSGKVSADAKQSGNWRESVARKELAKLSEAEQENWKQSAKEYNDARVVLYKKQMSDPPLRTPEARQAAIDAFPRWAAPLLQGVYARTGLHICMMLGGPMPKYNGQINVVCMSAGRNLQVAAKPYPQLAGFQTVVVPHFKSYLTSAFTAQEIEAASLGLDEFVACAGMEGDVPTLAADGLLTIDSREGSDVSDTDTDEGSSDDDSKKKKKKSRAKTKTAAKKTKGKAKALSDKEASTPPTKAKSKAKSKQAKSKATVQSDCDEETPAPPTKAKSKGRAKATEESVAPPPLTINHRPRPLAGCHIASNVPKQGGFDVTRPSETFSPKDPPALHQ
ncbi:hypothetical protein GGF50DRAFT_92549 [Schizophyllum commune]